MASEGVPAKMVDRIVVNVDSVVEVELLYSSYYLSVTGTVIGDNVFKIDAFGSGIFEMAAHGIYVKARAVHEKTAAVGWLENVHRGRANRLPLA